MEMKRPCVVDYAHVRGRLVKWTNESRPRGRPAVGVEGRAGSKAEYAKRAGVGFAPWNLPVVSAADLLRAARRPIGLK
jgi:hypothetical protein